MKYFLEISFLIQNISDFDMGTLKTESTAQMSVSYSKSDYRVQLKNEIAKLKECPS